MEEILQERSFVKIVATFLTPKDRLWLQAVCKTWYEFVAETFEPIEISDTSEIVTFLARLHILKKEMSQRTLKTFESVALPLIHQEIRLCQKQTFFEVP